MRAVVQRVSRAGVTVKGNTIASIGPGLAALVGFHAEDGARDLEYIARKMMDLRIFDDDRGMMNRSLHEVDGELLLVSQFTLYGDARKGRRPSYSDAMAPDKAVEIYNDFIVLCRSLHPRVVSGEFGAEMRVEIINEGPVTILLDSGRLF